MRDSAGTVIGSSATIEQKGRFEDLRSHLEKVLEIAGSLNDLKVTGQTVNLIKKTFGKINMQKMYMGSKSAVRCLTDEEAIELAAVISDDSPYINMTNEEKMAIMAEAEDNMDPVEFAAEMQRAAMGPIAKKVIEESIARRIFSEDTITSGNAKMYRTKKRDYAYAMGKFGDGVTQLKDYPFAMIFPHEYSTHPEVGVSDMMDYDFDVVGDVLGDAGKEMAVKEDSQFWNLMFYATSNNRYYGVTNNYQYPYGTAAAPASAGWGTTDKNCYYLPASTDPNMEVINKMNSRLGQLGYKHEIILMNPYTLAILMSQDSLLNASNFGSNVVQTTGSLGTILGLNVMTSRLLPVNRFYILDRSESCRVVQREPITVTPDFSHRRVMSWDVTIRSTEFLKQSNAIVSCQFYT